MSTNESNDLPPLAAGATSEPHDPSRDAFEGGNRPIESTTPAGGAAVPTGEEEKSEVKPESHPQFVGTGVFWGLVIGVILSIIVIVFAAQNTQSATIKTIVWDWSSPLFVVVLISLIIGIVLDEIVGLLYRARRRRRLAEKAELHRLRGRR